MSIETTVLICSWYSFVTVEGLGLGLGLGLSRNITKHLMSGPSGNKLDGLSFES